MHREKPRHMVWRKSMTQVVFQSHSKQSKRIDLKIKSIEKNKCLNEFIRENLHFLERAHLLRQCQPGGVWTKIANEHEREREKIDFMRETKKTTALHRFLI